MTIPNIEYQSGFEQSNAVVEREYEENGTGAQSPATISVCIVARNEADKLELCLQSVLWADEIVFMDLESTDNSILLARQYGARVVTREPYPIVEPLRNELAKLAQGEWILALDPDERVTEGLARELRRLALHSNIDAVVIPRMNWDLGYPPSSSVQRYEPQLRMYRRSRVTWPIIPNTLPEVPKHRKYRLPNSDDVVLIHDRSRNIPEVLDRYIRYAPAQAQSMVDNGQTLSAKAMMVALMVQVDKEFFAARAWRDGIPGMLRAGILVGYKFFVWAAFWQLSGAQRTKGDDRLLARIGTVLETLRGTMRVMVMGIRAARRLLGEFQRWKQGSKSSHE